MLTIPISVEENEYEVQLEALVAQPHLYTGDYEVTPTESEQTLSTSGKKMTDDVTVGAISSTYVGSGIARKSSSDMTAIGPIVTAPAGYYESNGVKRVASGTQGTPVAVVGEVSNHKVSVTPKVNNESGYILVIVSPENPDGTVFGEPVEIEASDLVSGNKAITENGTNIDVTNYETVSVDVNVGVNKNKTVTPTESEQTVTPDEGYTGLGEVTVEAIDDDYVGSAITRRDSDDLTTMANNVIVPKGYYASNAHKGVQNGAQGTPVATKGTVSGHKVFVTPSVLNTTGWIMVQGTALNPTGTVYGDAVEVKASELVSGNKAITENGDDIDVTNYATVSVDVDTVNNQNKTVTPTESEQTVTPNEGYTGLGEVTVEAIDDDYVGSAVIRRDYTDISFSGDYVDVPYGYYEYSNMAPIPHGTAGTPRATKGTVSNHSVSVTPSVVNLAGYIDGETKTGTAVSVSASELVSGTKSISANGTEDVTNYASVSVAVPNSYSASDEGKVVDNGALVSQSSATYTANDTYDTTLINEVTVNVSGGGNIDFSDIKQDFSLTNIGSLFTAFENGKWDSLEYTCVSGTNPIVVNFGRPIKGLLIYPKSLATDNVQGEACDISFSFWNDPDGDGVQSRKWGVLRLKTTTTTASAANTNLLSRLSSYTLQNGVLSMVPQYTSNAAYHPLRFSIPYIFLYWWEDTT